jgi:DNA anti-recombination protein RmuC
MSGINMRDVISFLTGSGFCGILLSIIFPRLLEQLMSRKLEQFKDELRSAGFQREVHFAWFHGERAKATMQIYERLGDVRTASHLLAEAATLSKSQDELQRGLRQRLEQLITQLNRTQILLDEGLRERIRSFAQGADDAASLLKNVTSVFDEPFKVWKERELRITELLAEIEKSFRESLSAPVPAQWS